MAELEHEQFGEHGSVSVHGHDDCFLFAISTPLLIKSFCRRPIRTIRFARDRGDTIAMLFLLQ